MSATTSLTQRIREREPRASSCGHRARSAAAGERVSFDIYITLQSVSQLFQVKSHSIGFRMVVCCLCIYLT